MQDKLVHALGWAIGIVSLALASRPVDDPNGMLDPDKYREER
jgi:hypothetical protein